MLGGFVVLLFRPGRSEIGMVCVRNGDLQKNQPAFQGCLVLVPGGGPGGFSLLQRPLLGGEGKTETGSRPAFLHARQPDRRVSQHPFHLTEQPGAPSKDEVANLQNLLLAGDPFVDEITIIDQAGKVPFRVTQTRAPEGTETVLPERETMSPAAMHEILAEGNAILIENTGDFLVRLVINPDAQWGYVKVHWKPEASWKYFNLLKWSILCVTGAAFVLSWGSPFCS